MMDLTRTGAGLAGKPIPVAATAIAAVAVVDQKPCFAVIAAAVER